MSEDMHPMLVRMIQNAGDAMMFEPQRYKIHPLDTPEAWDAAMRAVLSVLSDLRFPTEDVVRAAGRAAWHSGSGQKAENILLATVEQILGGGPQN